jgi:acyl-[acyl-carrier-protein]-phospholipid O-acyltransferase/long-chain-fatty-acid--[acyl-carrier-protein] ligase
MLLHHQFIRTAKRLPDKTAIIDRTTGQNITYGKALIAALILADKFKSYDPGAIGIMLPTSAGAVLSILGALCGGRVPIMINYSTGAAENAKFAQERCGFKTIVTSRALLDKIKCRRIDGMVFIEEIMDSVSLPNKLKVTAKTSFPAGLIGKFFVKGRSADDNALILFTSGSEKEPKAVPLTHRNIGANVAGLIEAFELSETDVFMANLPYFHVFGQTANLWVPLTLGMTIATYANPLDYKMIPRIVREERATLLVGTPSFFWGYLQKSEPGDFATLRIALAGADKCPDALREAWAEKHRIPLIEAYGTTETSPAITVNTPGADRPGSVGRPLPGMEIKIIGLETGKECGTGETGKILVKGDSVMNGYLNDIEETSLRIKNGWYDTGDMGYLDEDGYLWLAGRLKRFAKIGGEMVSLVRIEDELQRLLPADVGCCVVELPDAVKGAKIVAAVTGRVEERSVLKKLAERLPPICLPKRFVELDELPTMGSGKIDFRRVAEMVAYAGTEVRT